MDLAILILGLSWLTLLIYMQAPDHFCTCETTVINGMLWLSREATWPEPNAEAGIELSQHFFCISEEVSHTVFSVLL